MIASHPLGTVERLWRYPVKSLRAEPLEHIEVALDGIVGDRRRALFVTSPDHARSGRTYRGKEHALLHTVAAPGRARDLGAERGIDLGERSGGPYFDAEPVSLVVDTWVHELERMTGLSLDPQRFRPNLLVRAAASFAQGEAALVGRSIVVGTVRLEVVSTTKRCVTTTYDVATGEATPLVLRALAQRRDNVMGVYCRPSVPGTVALGDELTVDVALRGPWRA